MIRLAASTAVAYVALLVLAAVAPACVDPHLAPPGDPPPAGPNDLVRFTISNTGPGAEYIVSVEGRQLVDAFDKDGGGVSDGSFRMPDLGGRSRTVQVVAQVQHDGLPYDARSFPLVYRGTDPAPSPQSEARAPAPAAPLMPTRRPERIAQSGGREQTATHGAGHGGSSPSGGAGPPGSGPGGGPGPSTPPSNPASPANDRSAAASTAAAGRRALRTGRQRSAARTEVRPESQPGRGSARQAPARVPAPADPRQSPPLLIWLVPLLAGGIVAGLLLIRRRRGGASGAPAEPLPSPVAAEAEPAVSMHDQSIEAELQEIVAEERVRQLHAEGDAAPTGPG